MEWYKYYLILSLTVASGVQGEKVPQTGERCKEDQGVRALGGWRWVYGK